MISRVLLRSFGGTGRKEFGAFSGLGPRQSYFYFLSARQRDAGNKIHQIPTEHILCGTEFLLLCEAATPE